MQQTDRSNAYICRDAEQSRKELSWGKDREWMCTKAYGDDEYDIISIGYSHY